MHQGGIGSAVVLEARYRLGRQERQVGHLRHSSQSAVAATSCRCVSLLSLGPMVDVADLR